MTGVSKQRAPRLGCREILEFPLKIRDSICNLAENIPGSFYVLLKSNRDFKMILLIHRYWSKPLTPRGGKRGDRSIADLWVSISCGRRDWRIGRSNVYRSPVTLKNCKKRKRRAGVESRPQGPSRRIRWKDSFHGSSDFLILLSTARR